ncbi:hypothetical protein HYC85_002557 [Camellia sinensis]|uniref:DUS-like FMN-binding domain-containing protein n=1 Tax=Camellia sinensis TaxID=4442 RepID=A0A7J7IAU6_CAMSI|nr:hypothetical protein HYC85_002557 [Camellia sinensis]
MAVASSTLLSLPADEDHRLCCEFSDPKQQEKEEFEPESVVGSPRGYLSGESRIERAWAHWKKLGQPKLIVAPMVDNSELPFRMLCRKYGAQAAYTPMLHSRIFTENEKYRSQEFTTCKNIQNKPSTTINSPFVASIRDKPLSPKFKMPSIDSFDGTTDLVDHLETYRTLMILHAFPDEIMCRGFPRDA